MTFHPKLITVHMYEIYISPLIAIFNHGMIEMTFYCMCGKYHPKLLAEIREPNLTHASTISHRLHGDYFGIPIQNEELTKSKLTQNNHHEQQFISIRLYQEAVNEALLSYYHILCYRDEDVCPDSTPPFLFTVKDRAPSNL